MDGLLTRLEELNLAEERRVPMSVALSLEDVGVQNAGIVSIPELIERLFDLQEPLLKVIASRARSR